MQEKNIGFVVRYYRKGAFSSRAGWLRMGLGPVRRWTSHRIAAAIALGVMLSVTAAVLIRNEFIVHEHVRTEGEASPGAQNPGALVREIDFDNASLSTVIIEIEKSYGIGIDNVPENASQYRLTLHYEGDAYNLVETINEILELNLAVKE